MTARHDDYHFEGGIDLSCLPSHLTIVEGKWLPDIAKRAKVPFGRVTVRTYRPGTTKSRKETVGLVMDRADEARFREAMNATKSKSKSNV